MADDEFLKSSKGALWVQPDGPNTEPFYLSCHDLDPIAEPAGGLNLLRCFDPNGEWEVKGSTRTPPDAATTTLTLPVGNDAGLLETIEGCEFTLLALMRSDGRADVLSNYVRGAIVQKARITSRTRRGYVRREEEIVAERVFEVQAQPPVVDVFSLKVSKLSTSETEDLVGLAMDTSKRCASGSATAQKACRVGYATPKAVGASPADVALPQGTDDYGATWAATAAGPFAAGFDAGAVQVFQVGRGVALRVLAVRAETDAGSPAQASYSDDEGATWSQVNIGAVNAQFGDGPHCLFARDLRHIWFVTNDGYVYFSSDGGVTWTAQEEGDTTVQDLLCVHFADADVGIVGGKANTLLLTVDGGDSYTALVGPAAEAASDVVQVNARNKYQLWALYSSGKMYCTFDGGETWEERTFSGSGAGSMKDLKFWDNQVGYMLHNDVAGAGRWFKTITGGWEWEQLTVPTNTGLNCMVVGGPNLAYAVGDASGGTGVILKASI